MAKLTIIHCASWRHGRAVRQRSAKPFTPVQLRLTPPVYPEKIRCAVLHHKRHLPGRARIFSEEEQRSTVAQSLSPKNYICSDLRSVDQLRRAWVAELAY